MHYNTCDHGTVKRVVQPGASTDVQASSIASKIFVIIVIRDHVPTSIEVGRTFSIDRDMQYYSNLVACSRFLTSAIKMSLGPGIGEVGK